jgi:hypothetical protein
MMSAKISLYSYICYVIGLPQLEAFATIIKNVKLS